MYHWNKNNYVDLTESAMSDDDHDAEETTQQQVIVVQQQDSIKVAQSPMNHTNHMNHMNMNTNTNMNTVLLGSKVYALENMPSMFGHVSSNQTTSAAIHMARILPSLNHNVAQRNQPRTRKRKIAEGWAEQVDSDPCQQFLGGAMPTTTTPTTTPMSIQKRTKLEEQQQQKRQQIRFRHILMGNETSNWRAQEKDDGEEHLHFIPDFMPELHEKLTKVEREYAWLLEESNYLYRQTEPTYLYHYASPSLKILLRQKKDPTATTVSSDAATMSLVVPLENQPAFFRKRAHIALSLRQGHRRGPIMSRVLATLRFQHRRTSLTKITPTATAARAIAIAAIAAIAAAASKEDARKSMIKSTTQQHGRTSSPTTKQSATTAIATMTKHMKVAIQRTRKLSDPVSGKVTMRKATNRHFLQHNRNDGKDTTIRQTMPSHGRPPSCTKAPPAAATVVAGPPARKSSDLLSVKMPLSPWKKSSNSSSDHMTLPPLNSVENDDDNHNDDDSKAVAIIIENNDDYPVAFKPPISKLPAQGSRD